MVGSFQGKPIIRVEEEDKLKKGWEKWAKSGDLNPSPALGISIARFGSKTAQILQTMYIWNHFAETIFHYGVARSSVGP